MNLLTRPCTIITRTEGTIDAYGDAVKVEASVDTVCELQPIKSDEQEAGNQGISTYRLYLPGTVSPPDADGAIVIGSERYELVGDAIPRRNPRTGDVPFVEAVVRRQR